MASQTMTNPPAAPEQAKRSVQVIGGPLHGRWISERITSPLKVATGPDPEDDTLYFIHHYHGGPWRVPVPFWVHGSLIRGGRVIAPAHLLPSYMRTPQEVCPLLPRVRK